MMEHDSNTWWALEPAFRGIYGEPGTRFGALDENREVYVAEGVEESRPMLGGLEDDEAEPEFDRSFQEKFRRAMLSMIRSAEYMIVFKRFCEAYEYRKKFPWLGESKEQADELHQEGLAYALRAALVRYLIPDTGESGGETAPGRPRAGVDGEQACIDAAWAGRLESAVSATIKEGFSLEDFGKRLGRAGVEVAAITPAVLQKYIAASLFNYYDRRLIGLAPDPF